MIQALSPSPPTSLSSAILHHSPLPPPPSLLLSSPIFTSIQVTSAKRKDKVASSTKMANGTPAGFNSIMPIPMSPIDDQHLQPPSMHAMKSRGHSRSLSVPGSPDLLCTAVPEVEPSLRDNLLLGPEEHVYLSPIVLRKELERHLRLEKEILSEDFMKNSPVLFWNMVSPGRLHYSCNNSRFTAEGNPQIEIV